MRHDEDGPTVPLAGQHAEPDDDPTTRFSLDMPVAPGARHHNPLPLPQGHSQSVTVPVALPKRVPAPPESGRGTEPPESGRGTEPPESGRGTRPPATPADFAGFGAPADPDAGSQSPITLRIGRGVEAVERSRRIRSAAQRARTRARHIGNVALTIAVMAAGVWAGWEWWQRWHPQLQIQGVSVTVVQPAQQCNAAYDVVGAIASNGKAGTVTYQWLRSDGAATKRLTVNVPAGQRSTTVHLHWTFTGTGTQAAAATLKLFAPNEADGSGRFVYACVR